MNTINELWADVPYTKGIYQISNKGRLRSWTKKGSTKIKKADNPTILKPVVGSCGYYTSTLTLHEKGVRKTLLIHRLVAELFIENTGNLPVVMHKDDNKLNNVHTNLMWGNQSLNSIDALEKKLYVPAKGSARNKSNLTEEDVLFIFNSSDKLSALANKYGLRKTAIRDIRVGRSWNHVTGLLCVRRRAPKHSKDIQFK